MKHKRFLLFLLLLACFPLLSGCVTQGMNPLSKVEATPVPGLSMQLHAASASNANVDPFVASLYYRFLDQPMLTAETRMLTVSRDESAEFAIVKALLEGPSAGHGDLQRLFPDNVLVESAIPRNNVLFITFSESLLTGDGIPDNWASQPEWASEAPLRRRLMIQSVVASITESFPYTGVQILINHEDQTKTSLRLENEYFLDGREGLSDPQLRNEALLLTPKNTAEHLLKSWQSGDIETFYSFFTNLDNGNPKPSYQQMATELDGLPTLSSFAIQGGGSVSADGQNAVLTVDFTLLRNGESSLISGYPLLLTRENDVWKIHYSDLLRSVMP